MKFCNKCGSCIKNDNMCCSVCGQPIEGNDLSIKELGNVHVKVSYPIPPEDTQMVKRKSDKKAIAVVVIMGVIISTLVIGMVNYKGNKEHGKYNSSNQALEALADGLTKADGKAICHTMLTDEMMGSITQDQFDSMSETIVFLNSAVSMATGEETKWEIYEKSSVKLSEDEIDRIKYYYSSHLGIEIDISQGYQVKARMEFGSQSDHVYINVIEVHDEGWKVSEEFLSTVMGLGTGNAMIP